MAVDPLDLGIEAIKGIGPGRVKLLARMGIYTIKDSLYYLPFRYEDRSSITNICSIRENCFETVKGQIISSSLKPLTRSRNRIFELIINDGTGILKARWFNQPFLQKNFRTGEEVILSGQVKRKFSRGWETLIDNPEYEVITGDDDDLVHSNRIVPVYRLTEGMSQKQFRKMQFTVINEYAGCAEDIIPRETVQRNDLPSLHDSLRELHFPATGQDTAILNSGSSIYHRRLVFEEFLLFELGLIERIRRRRAEKGIAFSRDGSLCDSLIRSLPFQLTKAQKRVINDILSDMTQPWPMNRLLQGDVGCGKTIVAVLAMLRAVECGYQAALMAPTEILAGQHYLNTKKMLEGLGIKTVLLAGGTDRRQLKSISSGEMQIIVGTHAVIQEDVKFSKLGFAVIDEQHKFGVVQRGLLKSKGANPHVLVMTATPIPRSLALTVYGDLDYSVIEEMPAGRKTVITRLFSPHEKPEIYGLMKTEISTGRQAYVVYPAIDESESGLKSAIMGKEAFQRVFPEFRVGLLHGRMSTSEKDSVMETFRRGGIDILVSTTVIEVGVDVPNATVMLIVHAERFGLAQLHQLRGRVGRGGGDSYCLLIAFERSGDDVSRRLDIMVRSSDGFRIAEEDLAIRGPGDFTGTRQSGMPDLRFANISRDGEILDAARREAAALVVKDPDLAEFASLHRAVDVFWKAKNESRGN